MNLLQRTPLRIFGLLCLCACVSYAYVPVIYPSMIEQHGFVYHEDSRRVLSLPGGVEPLLCRQGETNPFDEADRECSDVVVFTSSESITFQILNLSTNGVIQPFTSIPEVKLSNGMDDQISMSAYGSAGLLNIETIGREDSDSLDETAIDSAVAPSSEPAVDASEGSEISAEQSDEAMDPEEYIDVAEGQDDDDTPLSELMRELPESVTPTGRDSIDASVLEANSTVGFLYPDGRIKSDRVLLVESRIDHIPQNELIRVRVLFGHHIRRKIFIHRDASPTTARIQLMRRASRVRSGGKRAHFEYRVDFSKFVVNTPNRYLMECPYIRTPLSKISSHHLTSGAELNANDLRSVIIASREFSQCSSNMAQVVPEELVQVTGVSAEIEERTPPVRLSRQSLRHGRIPQTSVLVSFDVDLKRRTRLEINVRSSAGVDLAGQSVQTQSEMYSIERRNRATKKSVNRADDIGTTTTVVASTSVATSVTVTVGASMAVSMSGSTAATTGAGGMTAGSVSGAIELISMGQRIYLIARMGIPNMPENFEAFSDSLSWTMLDIKAPWRENSVEQRLYRSDKETDVDNEEEDDAQSESDVVVFKREWPYERLVLVLFWTLILFASLIALHCVLVAVFFTLRYPLPDKLRFPRLELYLLYWVTPAIAGACASLFTGSKNQIALGIILLILMPVSFLLWHVWILLATFLKKPEEYRVFYEVKGKNTVTTRFSVSASNTYGEVGTDPNEEELRKTAQSNPKPPSFIERYLWTPLLGPPYVSGDWKTVEGPSNKFVDRFGPVFEDYRHIPGRRKDATFEVSEEANSVHRGHFCPFRSSWNPSRIANVMQVSGTVLRLSRMIFIACFILGQDDPSNNSQGIVLLVLSISYLTLLRVLRPHNQRMQLGIALLEEILNIATYCIVLYLLNNNDADDQEVRRNIGFLMIGFEGLGFFLIFCDQVYSSWGVLKMAAQDFFSRFKKDPQILDVLVKAQLQNPRYLERKYFHRWVKLTLGKGVYPGVLMRDKNVPFEEMLWVDPKAALRGAMFPSCIKQRKKEST